MVGVARIELATPAMSTQCSTTELHAHPGQPMRLGEAAFREQLRKAQPSCYRCAFGLQSRPCWSSVWKIRSTSMTRSFRWNGFDSSFASGRRAAALEGDGGKAGDEHHADRRVDRARLLGEFDPVHFRHHDVGQQQDRNARVSSSGIASVPQPTAATS